MLGTLLATMWLMWHSYLHTKKTKKLAKISTEKTIVAFHIDYCRDLLQFAELNTLNSRKISKKNPHRLTILIQVGLLKNEKEFAVGLVPISCIWRR